MKMESDTILITSSYLSKPEKGLRVRYYWDDYHGNKELICEEFYKHCNVHSLIIDKSPALQRILKTVERLKKRPDRQEQTVVGLLDRLDAIRTKYQTKLEKRREGRPAVPQVKARTLEEKEAYVESKRKYNTQKQREYRADKKETQNETI